MNEKTIKLRVWWIPQIPGKPFTVAVETLTQGVTVMQLLADYDAFQYEHNIRPDYANVGGISMYDAETNEWLDWFDEETGEDDPEVWLNKDKE